MLPHRNIKLNITWPRSSNVVIVKYLLDGFRLKGMISRWICSPSIAFDLIMEERYNCTFIRWLVFLLKATSVLTISCRLKGGPHIAVIIASSLLFWVVFVRLSVFHFGTFSKVSITLFQDYPELWILNSLRRPDKYYFGISLTLHRNVCVVSIATLWNEAGQGTATFQLSCKYLGLTVSCPLASLRITLLRHEKRPLITLALVLASLWTEAIKSLNSVYRTLCYFPLH